MRLSTEVGHRQVKERDSRVGLCSQFGQLIFFSQGYCSLKRFGRDTHPVVGLKLPPHLLHDQAKIVGFRFLYLVEGAILQKVPIAFEKLRQAFIARLKDRLIPAGFEISHQTVDEITTTGEGRKFDEVTCILHHEHGRVRGA